jgi:hypothetical protein
MEFIKNKILVALYLFGCLGVVNIFFSEVSNQCLFNLFFSCFFIANEYCNYYSAKKNNEKLQKEIALKLDIPNDSNNSISLILNEIYSISVYEAVMDEENANTLLCIFRSEIEKCDNLKENADFKELVNRIWDLERK